MLRKTVATVNSVLAACMEVHCAGCRLQHIAVLTGVHRLFTEITVVMFTDVL
jgi:hypothetical protein